jgi:hypothetical protein
MRDRLRADERLLAERRGRPWRRRARSQQATLLDGREPTLHRRPAAGFWSAESSDTIADLAARLPLATEQEQRPADRAGPEVTAANDAARNDGADAAASAAAIPPNANHEQLARRAGASRTTDLALAYAMTHEPEPTTQRTRRRRAPGTPAGPCLIHGRNALCPKLDVNA